MRINLVLLFVLSIFFRTTAQTNLVVNPSFEEITNCPYENGQIYFAEGWFTNNISSNTLGADLYNACSSDPFLYTSVPIHRFHIHKLPNTGNGYAGVFSYTYGSSNNGTDARREYLLSRLLHPTIAGRQYYISFFVSPEKSNDPADFPCYTDAIGVAFSKDSLSGNEDITKPLNLIPAIENRGTLLNEPDRWTKISGSYTAKGEAFIFVGNFQGNENVLVDNECRNSYPNNSYHYIDDISVYEFDPLPDTILLCAGESHRIGRKFLDVAYQWNTGATDSTIVVNQEGRYIVRVAIDDFTMADTVEVISLDNLAAFLPKDTLVCHDETLHLEIPIPGNYEWSNGLNSNTLSIEEPGIYGVTITTECGLLTHDFELEKEICDCKIYVPNAFSPNGDGVNDFLEIYAGCDFEYQITTFKLFDRWGGLVYSVSEGGQVQWDGSAKGKPLPEGVYTWFLNYAITRDGVTEKRAAKDQISLLR